MTTNLTQIATQQILDFWFGPLDSNGIPVQSRHQLWFGFDPAIDQQVSDCFSELFQDAEHGQLVDWSQQATSCLALILLWDQFSRHLFRGQKKAFEFDDQALQLSQIGIQAGFDMQFGVAQRIFFYMPFQHAESLKAQQQGLGLLTTLCAEHPNAGSAHTLIQGSLSSQRKHLEIIEQFGRFPHRNQVLQRSSTAAEQRYLAQSPERFGQ